MGRVGKIDPGPLLCKVSLLIQNFPIFLSKRTSSRMKPIIFLLSALFLIPEISAQNPSPWDFDQQLQNYFVAETQRIESATAAELVAIDDWEAYREQACTELLDMLGLHPLPERTPLQAVVTGTTEHEEFRVEKVHFQASPGLYVTGNLYVPKNATGKMPAILYVCGHANVVENGISYGAKVNYHHHAAWFARHGYVCLIIDTLQLGEIEGIHHGLYRYDRWWWLSRGYTPAGVEAWFAIRSIDYLVSRPEVDPNRIGMTGRSGGANSLRSIGSSIVTEGDAISITVPFGGASRAAMARASTGSVVTSEAKPAESRPESPPSGASLR